MILSASTLAAIKAAQRQVLDQPSSGDTGARTATVRLPGGMAVLLSLNK